MSTRKKAPKPGKTSSANAGPTAAQGHHSPGSPAAAASHLARWSVGDIVVGTAISGSAAFGAGRVCRNIGFGEICVIFAAPINCRRIEAKDLEPAAASADAPTCANCNEC